MRSTDLDTEEMTSTRGTGAGATPPPAARMTEAEFRSLYDRLRGSRPWGPGIGVAR
jgi:hypothetical protein